MEKLSDLDDSDLMSLAWLAFQLQTTTGNLKSKRHLIRKGVIPADSLPPLFQPPHSRPRVQVGAFKRWVAQHQTQVNDFQLRRGRGRPRKSPSTVNHL